MQQHGKRPVIAVLCNLLELCQSELKGIIRIADRSDVEVQIIPVAMVHTDYPGKEFRNRICSLVDSPRFSALLCFTRSLVALDSRESLGDVLKNWRTRPFASIGEGLFDEPVVCTDQNTGLTELLDHLFDYHGYKNPVFLTAPGNSLDATTRNNCFMEAVLRYKLPGTPERFVTGDWTLEGGKHAISEIYDKRKLNPDVIVCANDYMGLGARAGLMERGLLVPEDVALSGFDGINLSPNLSVPLASVCLPGEEAGEQAMTMILDILAGRPVNDIFLGSTFIPACTCGCTRLHHAIKYPALSEHIMQMPEQHAAALIHRSLLDTEVLDNLYERYYLRHIDNMTTEWVQSFFSSQSVEDHAEAAARTLDALGIGNFYLSVCDDSNGAPGLRSRLVVAREHWRMKDLPSGGVEFNTLELFPPTLEPEPCTRTVLLPFKSGNFHFGNIMLDFRPGLEPSIYQLCDRLAAAYLWIRESRRLQAINLELDLAKQKLEALSLTDELTHLHNRRGFITLATEQVTISHRNKTGFWIIFLDLDGLKKINDTWGHNEGDLALQAFAHVLKKAFRGSDIIARLGGDEFTVFVPEADHNGMDRIRNRLSEALEKANNGPHKKWRLDTSMGAYWCAPDNNMNLSSLMKEADQLLYEEKKRKKNAASDPK